MSSMFSYSWQMVNKHCVYMFTFTSIHDVKDLICAECFCVSVILWSWIDSCCLKFTDKSQNFPSTWSLSVINGAVLHSWNSKPPKTHQCLILTMLTFRNITILVWLSFIRQQAHTRTQVQTFHIASPTHPLLSIIPAVKSHLGWLTAKLRQDEYEWDCEYEYADEERRRFGCRLLFLKDLSEKDGCHPSASLLWDNTGPLTDLLGGERYCSVLRLVAHTEYIMISLEPNNCCVIITNYLSCY